MNTSKSPWQWLDDHLEETLLVGLLLVITALTGLQVVMRKIVNSPLSWSEELCRYCFMWSGFLGLGYCIRNNCEIRITTFVTLFPQRIQAVMALIADLVCLALYAALFYITAVIIHKAFGSEQISPAIGIPNYLIYSGAFLGFGCALFRLIQSMYRHVLDLLRPAVSASIE